MASFSASTDSSRDRQKDVSCSCEHGSLADLAIDEKTSGSVEYGTMEGDKANSAQFDGGEDRREPESDAG